MSHFEKLLVFLASPNDIVTEHRVVKRILDDLNRTVAAERGLILQPVHWENDSYPGYGRDAQMIINEQIAEMRKFKLFLGLMWKTIGTPTPRAQSGTVEEFERASEALKQCGQPEIWFYFRESRSGSRTEREANDLRQVSVFKDRVKANGMPWTYRTPAGFQAMLQSHFLVWLGRLSTAGIQVPVASRERAYLANLTIWADFDADVYVDGRKVLSIDHTTGFDYASARIRYSDASHLSIKTRGFEKVALMVGLCDPKSDHCEIRAYSDRQSDIYISKEEKRAAMGTEADAPILAEALRQQPKYSARAWAAERLGYIGGSKSVRALVDALRDAEPYVQATAPYALGRIGDASVLPEVEAAFGTYERKESYGYMFEAAIRELRFQRETLPQNLSPGSGSID
jgi:HEAT repeats